MVNQVGHKYVSFVREAEHDFLTSRMLKIALWSDMVIKCTNNIELNFFKNRYCLHELEQNQWTLIKLSSVDINDLEVDKLSKL